MAQLKLSELSPVGSGLFRDSETFLEELSDHELDLVAGGDSTNSVVSHNSQTVGSIQTFSVVGISMTDVTVEITNVNVSNVNASINIP